MFSHPYMLIDFPYTFIHNDTFVNDGNTKNDFNRNV